MNAACHIDGARPADEPWLRALARESALPGSLPIAFARDPDFFAALAVEGRRHRVWVARRGDTGEPVGYGVASEKEAWVNGDLQPLGYLSGLRLRPAWRGGRLIAQGYRDFLDRADPACTLYLTTILLSNQPALSLLGKPRKTLPLYRDAGVYVCRAITPAHRPRGHRRDALHIAPAREEDVDDLLAWTAREGASLQGFPRYTRADFLPGGLLQGLEPGRILLARRGDALVGCMGLWDQRAFRQILVTGYPKTFGALRPLYNLVARRRGLPVMPKPGRPCRIAYAALLCAQGRDANVLDALLDELLARARGRFDAVVVGAHASEPFAERIRRRNGVDISSRVFWVTRPACESAAPRPDGRPLYLEAGAL